MYERVSAISLAALALPLLISLAAAAEPLPWPPSPLPLPEEIPVATPSPQPTPSAKPSPKPTPTPRPSPSAPSWVRPVAGVLMNPFGYSYPFYGMLRSGHTGVDLAAPVGTPVYAVADAVVAKVWTKPNMRYGNYLVLRHDRAPYHSLYGHLASIQVSLGQRVKAGTRIATSGESGLASYPMFISKSWTGSRPTMAPGAIATYAPGARPGSSCVTASAWARSRV